MLHNIHLQVITRYIQFLLLVNQMRMITQRDITHVLFRDESVHRSSNISFKLIPADTSTLHQNPQWFTSAVSLGVSLTP